MSKIVTGPYNVEFLVRRLQQVAAVNQLPTPEQIEAVRKACETVLSELHETKWMEIDLRDLEAGEVLGYLADRKVSFDATTANDFHKALSFMKRIRLAGSLSSANRLVANGPVPPEPSKSAPAKRAPAKRAPNKSAARPMSAPAVAAPAPVRPVRPEIPLRTGARTNAELHASVIERLAKAPYYQKDFLRKQKNAVEVVMLAAFGKDWSERPLTATKLQEAVLAVMKGSSSQQQKNRWYFTQAVIAFETEGILPGGPAFRLSDRSAVDIHAGRSASDDAATGTER